MCAQWTPEVFEYPAEIYAMICAILAVIALVLTPILNIWMSKKYLAVIKEKGDAESSAYKGLFEEYKTN